MHDPKEAPLISKKVARSSFSELYTVYLLALSRLSFIYKVHRLHMKLCHITLQTIKKFVETTRSVEGKINQFVLREYRNKI